MGSFYLGSLGVAAAIVGAVAHCHTALADTSVPQAAKPMGDEKVDPLDPAPRVGEHELKTGEMVKLCDIKCQTLTFTEDTIPGLGASQLLYTILYPGKAGLSIPRSDGTIAVTFTVMPTKIARGKGLVAGGTF